MTYLSLKDEYSPISDWQLGSDRMTATFDISNIYSWILRLEISKQFIDEMSYAKTMSQAFSKIFKMSGLFGKYEKVEMWFADRSSPR